VKENGYGGYSSIANVECWRGTSDELLIPISVLIRETNRANSPLRIEGSIIWTDGTVERFTDLPQLRAEIDAGQVSQILALRVETIGENSPTKSIFVASRNIPGLQVEVTSDDPGNSLGIAGLVFSKMMIGYVDRMAAWRGLGWMLASISPLLLLSIAISPGHTSNAIRALIIILALVGSIATFLLVGPRMQFTTALTILEKQPNPFGLRMRIAFARISANSRASVFINVTGALLLGIIGNKISDSIPWP
jgi:hypothetical protein